MTIEIRPRPIGFGYRRQWPKTVHHITSFGTREVRVIVDRDERIPTIGLLLTILASFLY